MNVIIANKYKDALSSLDIDVIKKLDGEFEVETIVDIFANFYFNRMILDITALKNYLNIVTLQKLSAALDSSKIILLLDDDPRINNMYLSKIISLGIYNFTKDITGIQYLMSNPNAYKDVAQYHDLALTDERSLKESKSNVSSNSPFTSSNSSFVMPSENIERNNNTQEPYRTKVIGFKDLTEDAGSTTLVYMLKKNLTRRKVLAVEVNNNDFSYFNDSELISVSANQFNQTSNRFSQFDIVLIDLNNADASIESACSDIIYLLEPSTIKLNTLIRKDRQLLEKLKNNKIVLNKSLLTVSDVKQFEYEARAKIFYNIPPLDERKDTQMVLDSFLEKLGVYSSNDSNQGGIFSIFRR